MARFFSVDPQSHAEKLGNVEVYRQWVDCVAGVGECTDLAELACFCEADHTGIVVHGGLVEMVMKAPAIVAFVAQRRPVLTPWVLLREVADLGRLLPVADEVANIVEVPADVLRLEGGEL